MGLRDEVQTLAETSAMDKLEAITAELLPQDAAELFDLMNNHKVKSSHIGQALRRRGFDISDRTIQRHRQGSL